MQPILPVLLRRWPFVMGLGVTGYIMLQIGLSCTSKRHRTALNCHCCTIALIKLAL